MWSLSSGRSVSLTRTYSPIRRYASRPFSYQRDEQVDLIMCVQWSGADYVDNLMKTVTGGVSSTAAMGKGVTEAQFTKTKL
jgi:isocitrate lyase